MLLINKYSKGDTIIEVLFAISIFSLVAVGGLSIMNKGSAVTQRALEITLVRQQIDSQAEILRFLNSSYVKAFSPGASVDSYGSSPATPAYRWAKMVSEIGPSHTSASDFGTTTSQCPGLVADSFIFNTQTTERNKLTNTTFIQPSSYSQVRIDGSDVFLSSDGLWIEAVRPTTTESNEGGIGYIDFHIRACWVSIGQARPMTLGTIVRLYEPR